MVIDMKKPDCIFMIGRSGIQDAELFFSPAWTQPFGYLILSTV